MHVLVDADILVYRMAWACQKTHYQHKEKGEFFDTKTKAKAWLKDELMEWDESEWDITDEIEPWKNCKFLIDVAMSEILRNCGTDEYTCFLTPPNTFRYDIAVTRPYKAGRAPPPHWKDEAVKYFINSYNAVLNDQRLEADDMLGLSQTTDTVIASIDKDLYMIPGKHYDIVKKTHMEVDMQAADDWFFTQLLSGDISTDNIVGVPGIGNVKAKKLVAEFQGDHYGLVEEIEQLYELHYPGLGMDVMQEMAQLVYILRKGDTKGFEQWRKLLLLDE